MPRAPFTGALIKIARTAQHFAGLSWFEHGSQALPTQFDANRRWHRVAPRSTEETED